MKWARQHAPELFSALVVALTLYVVAGRLLWNLPLGSDLKVYYGATRSLWHWPLGPAIIGPDTKPQGGVYENPFWLSSGYFKYAPFALLLMTPVAAFPWSFAALLMGLLIGLALALLIAHSTQLARAICGQTPDSKPTALRWALLFTLLVAAHRDIYLENINLFLALALVVALKHLDKRWLAGALLGLVLALKPYFILLIAAVVVGGYAPVAAASLVSAVLLNLAPLLVLSVGKAFELTTAWLHAMNEHVSAATFTAFPNLLASFLPASLGLSTNARLMVALALVFGLLNAVHLVVRLSRLNQVTKEEARHVFLLATIALIPSLVPVDDQQFLFAAPLIAYVYSKVASLRVFKQRLLWSLLATVLAVLFAGNMPDLIGKSLSTWWTQAGLIGLANLGFVATATWLGLSFPHDGEGGMVNTNQLDHSSKETPDKHSFNRKISPQTFL